LKTIVILLIKGYNYIYFIKTLFMKKIFSLLIALLFIGIAYSQSVGIGTSTPAPCAQLDVSSTSKGFLPPRMDSNERKTIISPVAGLTIYNTSTNRIEVYNGTTWIATIHYVGESYGGGIIYYVDIFGQHGLIAATTDQSTAMDWGGLNSSGPFPVRDGIGAGMYNTERMIATEGSGIAAAQLCANFQGGGYGDWYLPSKYELNLMWLNIGQGASIGNVGGFANNNYWSSTELVVFGYNAWAQNFTTGSQFSDSWNDTTLYVRAGRAF
jgi:hypothetical protein